VRKIFAIYTSDKGLIARIYWELKKLNSQKNQLSEEMGKWTEQKFSKKEVQMAKKHMKNCSTSLDIKEMQIKSMLRFQPTLVRIATIKNTNNNKCWQGCGDNEILIHCWWECELVKPLWKTVWRFLKKLKLELPYDQQYDS
jgi:seryl-tRNA synthetase